MTRKRKKYPGIRSRGEFSYEINFYIKGKRHTETVKATSMAEAAEIRMRRIVEISSPSASRPQKRKVGLEHGIQYYLTNTEKTLHEKTRQRSECVYRQLTEFLSLNFTEIKYLYEITPSLGNRYKEFLLSKPNRTPSGINNDISKLRAIFTKFSEYDFIKDNPFKQVAKIPRRLARPKKKHLPTDNEIKIIIKAMDKNPSYSNITRFLIRVGRRIEETSLYLKTDVIFDNRGLPTKISVRSEITKTKEPGEIPLDNELSEIIQSSLNTHSDIPYLFTNVDKRKIAQNTYREHLKSICTKKNIQNTITPHCFRYYVVNKLLNRGINFKDAMAITGHLDIESFMSYVKTTESGRRKALSVTRLNRL